MHEHVVEHPRRERRRAGTTRGSSSPRACTSPSAGAGAPTTAPSSAGAGRTRGRGAGRGPTTSIRAGSMRRRMRSASSSAASCASASDIQRGNDTRNRSPTSAASTCLRRRVPRTSSISMAPSISSRCDSSRALRCRHVVAHVRVRSSTVPTARARATKILLAKRESRVEREILLDRRRARSYCRRCRFAAAPTPDPPPGGHGTGARAAGHAEPFGAARARAVGGRRGRPRGLPASDEGGRGTGPEEIGAATQRRLLGAFPRLRRRSTHVRGSRARRRRRTPTGTVAACVTRRAARRSRRAPARGRHRAARAARDPRARGLGQDPRAHAPHRVPGPRAARRGAPRARGHVHAHAPRASSSTGSTRSASTARSPPARSTRSRSRSCAAAPPTAASEPPRVLDRKAPGARARCSAERGPGASVALAITDVATEIEWAKARMIPPERYAAAARAAERRAAPPAGRARRPLRRATRPRSASKRWLDFDDLLGWLRRRDRDATPTSRPRSAGGSGTCSSTSSRTRRRCSSGCCARGSATAPTSCVVGDAAQAIYAFAGADASPLADFARHFPGGRTIALAYNYRSTDAIVAVAEAALGPASGVERDAPRAVRPADRPRTITAFDDDAHEADAVADACWHEFTGGVPWHRMAVLFRTNAQSSLFETAFTRRGVPFRVTGAQRFAARPAVRALLDRLREAERDAPGAAVRASISPTSRPTPTTDADADADDATRRHRRRPPPTTSCATHRDALLDFGREYLDARSGRGFGRRLRRRGSTSRPAASDATSAASTSSRSTGPRASSGRSCSSPGSNAGSSRSRGRPRPTARAEERRLLHVALGRAEDGCTARGRGERTAYGRRSARQPSPWLGELEQAIAGSRRSRRSTRRRASATRSRRCSARRAARSPTSHARRRRASRSVTRTCIATTSAPNASPTRCSRTRASGSRSIRCRSTTASLPTSSPRSRRTSSAPAGNDPDARARALQRGARARGDLVRQPALPRVHPGRAHEGVAAVRHDRVVRVDLGHLVDRGGGRGARREPGAAVPERPRGPARRARAACSCRADRPRTCRRSSSRASARARDAPATARPRCASR